MNEADAVAGSLGDLLALLVSSGREGADALVLALGLGCVVTLVAVHGSVAVRLIRVAWLTRDISGLYESRASGGREGLLRDLDRSFAGSLVAESWAELMRRRRELEAHAPEDRAPIRLTDLLIERPLIPLGIRRRAMHLLPGLFAALGLSTTLATLAGELGAVGIGEPVAAMVGLALRGAFWGVALGALAAALAAILEGSAEALASRLSLLVERSYRSLTPVEAQLRGAETQRLGFERVSSLLVQVAQDLRDSIDRGLGRIERSTASAANLVGEEQRRVLELVIQDLSGLLRRGIEEQVGALRASLQLAAEQQATLGERVVTTIDQMSAGAEGHLRVSSSLERAAQAVDEAAGTLAGSAGELKPLIVHLGEVAATLERASGRVEKAQALTNPTDEPSVAMLRALRDDVALIGAQFLEGATALRQSVEPFRQRSESLAQPDVAHALQNFDELTNALREQLGEESAEAHTATAGPTAEPEVPTQPDAAPDPVVRPVHEPRATRRGGDLASALARSGEGLEARDDLEARKDLHDRLDPRDQTPAESIPTSAAPEGNGETTEADLQPVGRGGFSALLSRYKAPQFSIEELPPDLREFNADDAERRAREARWGAAAKANAAAIDETEVLDPAAGDSAATDAGADERPAETSEPGNAAEAERRRRLERFLGSK